MHTQNDNRSEQPQQQTTAAFCTKLLFRENPSKCTRRKMQSAPFNKQNRLRSNEKCLQDGEPLANRPPHVFPTNLLLQAIVCFLLSPSKHSVNAAGDRQLWKLPSFHSSTRTSHGCGHNEHPHRALGLLTSPEQRSDRPISTQHSHDALFVVRARIPSRLLYKTESTLRETAM